MTFVGSLKDKNIADKIVSKFRDNEISGQIVLNQDAFNIFIEREEDYDKALDIYRVALGFPPLKYEIPKEWENLKKVPMGPLTLNMIILCVGIYLLSFTALREKIYENLMIGNLIEPNVFHLVFEGQAWRLITPIFLHFSFMHILFNMMWLKDLGKAFENEKGIKFYFLFILITGILSNMAQTLTNGPMFGGMSGVVYALLGHTWIYSTFIESAEFRLPKQDIYLMIGWYILCMTGLFGPIANVAHGVGLGTGMLFAFAEVKYQTLGATELRKKYWFFLSLAFVLPIISIAVEILKVALL